ncbi:MAG: hypothetical protein HWQ43_28845 [Nostoc sp. JL31]|nr:hypothetical protein [Nostoc sp. JL31]
MPKLPRITATEAEKLLLDAGFIQIRNKESYSGCQSLNLSVIMGWCSW